MPKTAGSFMPKNDSGQYNVSNIERVLDALIDDCSRLAMAELSAEVVTS
jgi:hypothetical protein